jgi:predicted transcriptional regulator YheO
MQTDDLEWMFEFLGRLAEGIQAVVGDHCEVVVHDLRDREHSVVAVAGGLTGRGPGAPIPDLAFGQEAEAGGLSDEVNYRSLSGGRAFRSSTIWLRDGIGQPVCAVCINMDYSKLLQAADLLAELAGPAVKAQGLTIEATFAKDIDELIQMAILEFLRREGIPDVDSLRAEDKRCLVQDLDGKDLFKIRGAVDLLAELLGVSRATIYNYRASQLERS